MRRLQSAPHAPAGYYRTVRAHICALTQIVGWLNTWNRHQKKVKPKADDAHVVSDYSEAPLCCGCVKVHGWDAVELKRLLPDAIGIPGNVCFTISYIAGATCQSVMCLTRQEMDVIHPAFIAYYATVRVTNGFARQYGTHRRPFLLHCTQSSAQ